MRSSQRVMIQSWRTEDFLQIVEETQSKEEKAFSNVVTHINDQFVDPEQQKDSQVRLINHKFQKIEKFRMMFEVEEVELEKARQAYQSSYVFDEMLEYYAFLNCWAVAPIDMATEAAEHYYYKHDLAVTKADDLHDTTSKMLLILQNIEERLKKFEDDPETYSKSKTQLQEQGILDVLCRILDIIYYKSTPPPMFQKPFKSSKTDSQLEQSKQPNEKEKDEVKQGLKTLRIDEYLAQEIARDHTEHLVMKVYELLITMAKTHRANSEKMTKYFNTFYQHYQVQEHYFQLSLLNPNFKTRSPKILMRIIGELFKKAQKNAMFVFSDRAAGTLVEHVPTKEQKLVSGADRSTFVAVDSEAAAKVIEGSTDINQVQKWLDLLEPVKFKSPDDQNLETQITILNIVSMFCRDR